MRSRRALAVPASVRRCYACAVKFISHLARAALALSLVVLCSAFARAATYPLPPSGDDIVGEIKMVTAGEKDTLLDIARRHGLGYAEITAANPGVDPWLPGAGARVLVPTQFILPPGPRRGLVLNLAQFRLFYFPTPKAGQPATVITYPIGIGTDYASTPLGETRIARKAANPVWRPSPEVREEHVADGHWLAAEVPPGPDNPLGKFALYLAMKGSYLIHGTNKPYGVGMRVSHGCIRLYPESIEALFPLVPIGTPVRVISERVVVGMRKGIPYVQKFSVPDTRATPEEDNLTLDVEAILRNIPRGRAIDWDKVMGQLHASRAIPVPIAPNTPMMEELIDRAHEAMPANTAARPKNEEN